MAHVRKTKAGYLYFDFFHRGVRCREYTRLVDSPANHRKMLEALRRIEAEITLGTFDYPARFPNGSRRDIFERGKTPPGDTEFEKFARSWHDQNKMSWKPSVAEEFLGTNTKHLIPRFAGRMVTEIAPEDIKKMRSDLAALPGRKNRPLSRKRINNICVVLRLILAEASERYGTPNPFARIKQLPIPKAEIHPFTFEEMNVFLNGVRKDFRPYYVVRFLTGMRTGEVDGLRWEDVDWANRKIRVRHTIYKGKLNSPKTESSVRDIDLLPPVVEALREQEKVTGGNGGFVFRTKAGTPLDHTHVTKRLWYPTLKTLGLASRTPYQTRHTAATLWLASGENPEWIARQLGHADTQMLFKVYSRFVPNLTRRDGSAFMERFQERVDLATVRPVGENAPAGTDPPQAPGTKKGGEKTALRRPLAGSRRRAGANPQEQEDPVRNLPPGERPDQAGASSIDNPIA